MAPEHFENSTALHRHTSITRELSQLLTGGETLNVESLTHFIENTFSAQSFSHASRNALNEQILEMLLAQTPPERLQRFGGEETLAASRVLAVEHCGAIDVSLNWQMQSNGTLVLKDWDISTGGGEANVAKVFTNFARPCALQALVGSPTEPTSQEWMRGLGSSSTFPAFQYLNSPQKVNIYHDVPGEYSGWMIGKGRELSARTLQLFHEQTEELLANSEIKWIALTVSAGLLHAPTEFPYRETVQRAHQYDAQAVIDFKVNSTPDQVRSVLEIDRKVPTDILIPNREELHHIARSVGLEAPSQLTEEQRIQFEARSLCDRYNLRAVVTTCDAEGLRWISSDELLSARGPDVEPVCVVAAGDSVKAGLLMSLCEGKSPTDCLHMAELFGRGTVLLPGSNVVTPQLLGTLQVDLKNATLPLRE